MAKRGPEPRHGTLRRYRRPWRCRCDECRAANTEDQHRRRRGLEPLAPYEVVSSQRFHTPGRACYNRGCREEECVEANRVYSREWAKAKRRGLTTKQLREQDLDLDLDQYLW